MKPVCLSAWVVLCIQLPAAPTPVREAISFASATEALAARLGGISTEALHELTHE